MQKTLAIFALMLAATIPAAADIIYDNGGPIDFGVISDYSYPGDPPLNPNFLHQESFILPDGNNIIGEIHWYGTYSGDVPAQSTFFVFLQNIVQTHYRVIDFAHPTRTTTGLTDASGREIFHYDLVIEPFEVIPQTEYLLLIADSAGGLPGSYWHWQASSPNGGHYTEFVHSFLPEYPYELAFYLTNDVIPEPASVGLLFLGVTALAVRFRMRRARS